MHRVLSRSARGPPRTGRASGQRATVDGELDVVRACQTLLPWHDSVTARGNRERHVKRDDGCGRWRRCNTAQAASVPARTSTSSDPQLHDTRRFVRGACSAISSQYVLRDGSVLVCASAAEPAVLKPIRCICRARGTTSKMT